MIPTAPNLVDSWRMFRAMQLNADESTSIALLSSSSFWTPASGILLTTSNRPSCRDMYSSCFAIATRRPISRSPSWQVNKIRGTKPSLVSKDHQRVVHKNSTETSGISQLTHGAYRRPIFEHLYNIPGKWNQRDKRVFNNGFALYPIALSVQCRLG